jgi:hypothetical protein
MENAQRRYKGEEVEVSRCRSVRVTNNKSWGRRIAPGNDWEGTVGGRLQRRRPPKTQRSAGSRSEPSITGMVSKKVAHELTPRCLYTSQLWVRR